MLKNLLLWLVIAIVLITVFSNFSPQRSDVQQYAYSQFLSAVNKGEVTNVTIQDRNIEGTTKNNQHFATYLPMEDHYLLGTLMKEGVGVKGLPPKQQSLLVHFLLSWGPFLLLIGVWVFFMRQMQSAGGKGGPLSFGRSKARLLGEDQVKVTFEDVAGVEEAKDEVSELVEFLRDPAKFQKLGGKCPVGSY